MKLLPELFDFERETTRGEVWFYRIFEIFIIYWVLYFAWNWGFYILKIGDVVLPLGIAQYVDISLVFGNRIPLIIAAAITAMIGFGFFRVWCYAYLVALVLLHVQYVSRFCLGEISHGSNCIGMVLCGMGLGTILYSDARHMRRFTFGFSYFFLGLGYTSAAVCKLIGTGPQWVDGAHMWLWIAERSVDTFSLTGSLDQNWVQRFTLDYYPLATSILTFGLLTELCGFLMWFKRTRVLIMTLLILMHVGILLSMRINFPANNVVLLLLAYPWARLIDWGWKRCTSAWDTLIQRRTGLV